MAVLCPYCGRNKETEQAVCPCGGKPEQLPSQRDVVVFVLFAGGAVVLLIVVGVIAAMLMHHRTASTATTIAQTSSNGPPPTTVTVTPLPPALPAAIRPPEIPTTAPIVAVPATKPALVAWPAVRNPHETDEGKLITRLYSRDARDREAGLEALQSHGWQPKDDKQRALVMVATGNATAAEKYGDDAVDALCVPLMDRDDREMSRMAASSLGRIMNPAAIAPLSKCLLESKDSRTRGAAATALGRIRDHQSIETLKTALAKESDDAAKAQIVAAIQKISDESEPDRLLAALKDDDTAVQFRAATLLIHANNPAGLTWMEQTLNGDDVDLRQQALAAIRQIGGPTAIKILVKRVNGKGYDGPTESLDALVAMGEPSIDPMVASLWDMTDNGRWMMVQGLARLGEPAMKATSASLANASIKAKKTLCQELGGLERNDIPHKPVEPLITMLTDDDAGVRRAAVDGLESLKWEPANDEQRQQFEKAKQK